MLSTLISLPLTLSMLSPGIADSYKSSDYVKNTKPVLVAHASEANDSWFTQASWYGVSDGYHGQLAADGSVFNAYDYTAAAPSHIPFGTLLRVTNMDTGLSVVVKVTDRGGFESLGRGLDLSYGAAREIGAVEAGVVPVRVEVL